METRNQRLLHAFFVVIFLIVVLFITEIILVAVMLTRDGGEIKPSSKEFLRKGNDSFDRKKDMAEGGFLRDTVHRQYLSTAITLKSTQSTLLKGINNSLSTPTAESGTISAKINNRTNFRVTSPATGHTKSGQITEAITVKSRGPIGAQSSALPHYDSRVNVTHPKVDKDVTAEATATTGLLQMRRNGTASGNAITMNANAASTVSHSLANTDSSSVSDRKTTTTNAPGTTIHRENDNYSVRAKPIATTGVSVTDESTPFDVETTQVDIDLTPELETTQMDILRSLPTSDVTETSRVLQFFNWENATDGTPHTGSLRTSNIVSTTTSRKRTSSVIRATSASMTSSNSITSTESETTASQLSAGPTVPWAWLKTTADVFEEITTIDTHESFAQSTPSFLDRNEMETTEELFYTTDERDDNLSPTTDSTEVEEWSNEQPISLSESLNRSSIETVNEESKGRPEHPTNSPHQKQDNIIHQPKSRKSTQSSYNASVTSSSSTPTTRKITTTTKPEICGIRYEGKCYILITGKLDYDDARKMCRQIEGNLADITSRQHYFLMMAYLHELVPETQQQLGVWTSMTLMISTGKVRLSNFKTATFTSWYPGQPTRRDYTRRHIYLHVPKIKSDSQGMVNYSPNSKLSGALCAIKRNQG